LSARVAMAAFNLVTILVVVLGCAFRGAHADLMPTGSACSMFRNITSPDRARGLPM